jgi:hypothetical protein
VSVTEPHSRQASAGSAQAWHRPISTKRNGPGVGDTEAVNLLGEVYSPERGLGSGEQTITYFSRP